MSSDEPVATGDRRGEVHYEADPGQLVRARFLARPDAPPPPDEHTARIDAGAAPAEAGPPGEDVAVAVEGPSVWDARPAGPGR